METIISAAIFYNGLIFSVPAPGRHHNVAHLMALAAPNLIGIPQREQGFLTSAGRYVSREEAFFIAFAAQQLIKKTHPLYKLFSEDVW